MQEKSHRSGVRMDQLQFSTIRRRVARLRCSPEQQIREVLSVKKKSAAIPKGYHTITPYFSVRKADRLLSFLKKAFGGKEANVMRSADDNIISAEVHIGDSVVFIGEEHPQAPVGEGMRGMFYMYVADVDAVYKKAIKAGGKSIQRVTDEFWGDRIGIVADIAGNRWWIAARQKNPSTKKIIELAERGPSKE
jgi:PhnB protein